MTRLERLWKDKWKIVRGILNTIFRSAKIELIAKKRQEICKSNKCGKYDSKGVSSNCFIKGKPACSICGCNIKILSHSMDSTCSLKEIGKEPLWKENIVNG